MLVSDFDFELPSELIAQEPPADRAGARMLAFDRRSGEWEDRVFRDLPEMLREGDLLVLNDTRVLPARLYARRLRKDVDSAGRIEVLLTRQMDAWEWRALVRPGKKAHTGERLGFHAGDGELLLEAEVIAEGEFGERTLRFTKVDGFFQVLEKIGHMPLPPYIRRPDAGADAERYQTVFAAERGSVAAPTAGLHFTPEVLERIRERGVRIAKVTLHVGLGTFQPVRVERVEDIRLHAEPYTLSQETADEINAAVAEDRRIIAAGTTTVRTLEHCARVADGGRLMAHSGETSLFLSPGAEFKLVGAMLTNFHLPQSTLLMLVCAFGGQQRVLDAYRHAVEQRYRFFSYGDCMFLS